MQWFRWALVAVFFLSLNLIKAQENCNLRIHGVISDEHDGSVLAYASVQLLNSSKGVSADEQGKYEMEGLCAGNIQFIISHIGCKTDTVSVKLKASQKLDFKLEHHWEELQTVNVDEQLNESTGAIRLQLDSNAIEQSRGKPLAEMLKNINGVNTMNTGSNISKPIIQGFSSNRVQILNHGVQHQGQQWGDEHAPEIDPFVPADYSVIKGAGAVKYGGGALGGFVLVEPKPLPQKVGISGVWNGLFASNNRMANSALMLEGKFKKLPKFSWRAQGSLKKAGNVRTPNYYQKNSGVEEYNYSWTIGYSGESWTAQLYYSQFNSNIGIFSGAHIGNLTDLRRAIERSEPRIGDQEGFSYEIRRPYQLIEHELTRLEVNKYFKKMGKLNVKVSRQFNIREEFDKERPRNQDLAALNIPEFSLSLESYALRAAWELPEFNHWETELGLSAITKENTVNSFSDFIPDYQSEQLSVFLVESKSWNQWQFEAGFRFDHIVMNVDKVINREFQHFDHLFSAITANTGLEYQFSNIISSKISLTFSERAPAINELYSEGLHHGTASLEFGNNQIQKERASALQAFINAEFNKLKMELQAYLQFIDNYIYLKPNGLDLTIRGAFPSFDWENTNALFRGIDYSFQLDIFKNLKLNSKWSFLWANNQKDNSYLVMIPANRTQNSLVYDLKLKEDHFLQLEVGNQYVFRQNRFDSEVEIAPPPDAYQLFHASVSMPFTYNKLKGKLGLQLTNAFNSVYRDYLNRFRYYTDEQGRNFRINLKIKF